MMRRSSRVLASRLSSTAARRRLVTAARPALGSTLAARPLFGVTPTAATRCNYLHTFKVPDDRPPAGIPEAPIDAPFGKLLAANRGEIATRICRAAAELGVQTAGIYSHEGELGE